MNIGKTINVGSSLCNAVQDCSLDVAWPNCDAASGDGILFLVMLLLKKPVKILLKTGCWSIDQLLGQDQNCSICIANRADMHVSA